MFIFGCNSNKEVENASPAIVYSSKPVESIPETKEEKCMNDMIYIHGNYCTKIKENCTSWIDDPSLPYARCKSYAKSECIGPKKEMDFCIEKYEHHDSNKMPITNISWKEAQDVCKSEGKRLCYEDEWNFAALGEDMKPYAHGYERYPSPCYIEQPKEKAVCGKNLCDIRRKIDDFPECKSDFGVVNQNGGVDEWIEVPKYQHSKIPGLYMRSALKGGHAWHNARARNLPITKDHDENFKMISIGFRCCSNIK